MGGKGGDCGIGQLLQGLLEVLSRHEGFHYLVRLEAHGQEHTQLVLVDVFRPHLVCLETLLALEQPFQVHLHRIIFLELEEHLALGFGGYPVVLNEAVDVDE